MRTALVATVKNEARRLPEFLESLERQTRTPDIIVIIDGGSTDGTHDLLSSFSNRTPLTFRCSQVPGNRSVGRNAAIRLSKADLIAVTDVSVLEPSWFERIITPLEEGKADVVAGWYELLVDTPRERAVGLVTQYSLSEVDPENFLPSSRSIAFTRTAWERVGGYPENLLTTEDTVFDLSLRRAGFRFLFEPRAVVRWRPATTFQEAYRMYRTFGESDGEAGIFLWSHTGYGFLYGSYAVGLTLLLLGFLWPILWILLGVLAITYLIFRLRKVLWERLWSQAPYAFLVLFVLEAARLSGYLRGRLRRSMRPRIAD